MKRISNFFIPTAANNYHPYLLRSVSLTGYLVVLFLTNVVFGGLLARPVAAAVDASALYQLHNEERARFGLPQLSINTDLVESANNKAQAMLAADCWSHYCPDGTSPWVFFDDVGYSYIYAGENLAEGFRENGSVMTAWMNSPTHRDNVLKPEFNEIGIGFAYGNFQGIANNTVVVVHFGSRSAQPVNLPVTDNGNGQNPVRITSPQDGSITNNNMFDIEGIAPDNTEVEIERNNSTLGRVNATGPAFTYRPVVPYPDGTSSFKATAYSGDRFAGTSDSVSVTIDTVAPQFVADSVRVNSIIYDDTEYALVSVRTSGDASAVTSNMSGTYFIQGADIWEGEVKKEQLSSLTNLNLTVSDKAGNSSSIEVSTGTLLSQVLALETSHPRPESNRESILDSFRNGIDAQGARTQLNMLFIVFLMSLFGIDFYVLSRTGMTAADGRKPHLHFSVLLVLLIIALLGGIGGTILTGVSTS